MRTKNQATRDRLYAVLAREGTLGAATLAARVGVSVATLHRLLAEAGGHVVAAGRARRARYALRRPLRGNLAGLPLLEVDADGRASDVGALAAVYPEGTWIDLSSSGWPVPEASRDGWWMGLPYPFHDMRPQGYMGRQFARSQHDALGVPFDPNAWTDDDVLVVLSRLGHDLGGSLILGDASAERWMAGRMTPPTPLRANRVAAGYAALAETAIAAGVAGSSAAGEFPKFTALRELSGSATPHVIVKFSGADGSAAVRRWSDLLVSEHLALEVAATLPGVASASSRIVQAAGRTFLEVERFDRHGLHGRSRLASLETLNAALLGAASTDWPVLAERLATAGLVSADDVDRIRHLWWFGRLIANTDMHLGNLGFRPVGTLALAPTYDMVPMLYAPLAGGEVPARTFDPPLPLPAVRACWVTACAAAIAFWSRAAKDARASEPFRAICASNAARLSDIAARV
jgi:hypothetical protein